MGAETKARFILELDMKPEAFQFHVLEKRFEIGRKMYNACKHVMWEQLQRMFKDPAYQQGVKQPKSEERSVKLRAIRVPIHPKDTYAQKALHHEIAFCRIKRKFIRGKYDLQLILKGTPPLKQEPVVGEVGMDIGISTVAAVSDDQVWINEFCDGLDPIEKEKRRLQRKLDRSRRATNPDKYKANRTIHTSNKKPWVRSENYWKTLFQLKEIHREIAAKRKIMHNQTANRILRMRNVIYVEKMNDKGLQKGWFGKRIGYKAPSKFLAILDTKLGYHGEHLRYVNTWKVKTSQFDPHSNQYEKKRLSQRFHITGQGHKIQRDCFSAFLLKHVNKTRTKVDRKNCLSAFPAFYEKYQSMVATVQSLDKKWISSIGF